MITFQEFPKIPRLRRELVITEKLDGTNAAVRWEPIDTNPDPNGLGVRLLTDQHGTEVGAHQLFAQSRTRFITPESDNYGFAGWAKRNIDELTKLGPGTHFGEWWGAGIQRRYGLEEKRFSLFNVQRWGDHNPPSACCHVVPILARGTQAIQVELAIDNLRLGGSVAAPGFMNPEGVIVWHSAARSYFKVLLENDDTPKGRQE